MVGHIVDYRLFLYTSTRLVWLNWHENNSCISVNDSNNVYFSETDKKLLFFFLSFFSFRGVSVCVCGEGGGGG